MTNRIIPALITAFWLVMTGALVWTELFPPPVEPVPTQEIVDLIFEQPQREENFIVQYRDAELGVLRLIIREPVSPSDATRTDTGVEAPEVARVMGLNGNLALLPFGLDSYLRLNLWTSFDKDNEMKKFRLQAGLKRRDQDTQVTLTGIGGDPRLMLEYTFGQSENRQTMRMAGDAITLVQAMSHEIGLAKFGVVNMLLSMAQGAAPHPETAGSIIPAVAVSSYKSTLKVQDVNQPMYVIEGKTGEEFWVKLWVDKTGEIILFESSAEINLRNAALFPSSTTAEAPPGIEPND